MERQAAGRHGHSARALTQKNRAHRTSKSNLEKQQSNLYEERLIHPGRWPRRGLMLVQLLWSTAVIKCLLRRLLMYINIQIRMCAPGSNFVRGCSSGQVLHVYVVLYHLPECPRAHWVPPTREHFRLELVRVTLLTRTPIL